MSKDNSSPETKAGITGNPQATPGELDKANSTKMVVVGCKLPNGIILELGKRNTEGHKSVRLRGSNTTRVIGGFGLTDVSEDFMTAWLKKNARLSFVKRGLIFIQGDQDRATAHALHHSELKTGLEPLTPKDMPKKVEVDEEHFKRSNADFRALLRRAG